MKKEEQQELKNLPESELKETEKQSRERMRVLRFDLSFGKVKNVREIRAIKKRIAKILTILKEREKNG